MIFCNFFFFTSYTEGCLVRPSSLSGQNSAWLGDTWDLSSARVELVYTHNLLSASLAKTIFCKHNLVFSSRFKVALMLIFKMTVLSSPLVSWIFPTCTNHLSSPTLSFLHPVLSLFGVYSSVMQFENCSQAEN